MWLKPLMVPIATFLDDWLKNGKRNPAKKWWFDHELVNGVAVAPKGTNQRDIDPDRKVDPAQQKVAIYHASMMPPPDEIGPVEVDRNGGDGGGRLDRNAEPGATAGSRRRSGASTLRSDSAGQR